MIVLHFSEFEFVVVLSNLTLGTKKFQVLTRHLFSVKGAKPIKLHPFYYIKKLPALSDFVHKVSWFLI